MERTEILQIRTDTIFHDLFNQEDMNTLEWAVMQILGCSYEEVHGNVSVGNIRLTRLSKDDRNKYLDLIVEYKNEKIVIELNNNFEGIYTRNIIYAANVITNNYKINDDKKVSDDYYKNVVKVLLINLNWYSSEKKGKQVPSKKTYEIPYSDLNEEDYFLKIVNVNLDYFNNLCYDEVNEGDKLYKLLTVKNKDELEEITKQEKLLDYYGNKLINLSSDEKYTEVIMDEIVEENIAKQTAYLVGKDDGIEEGIEQGKKEGIEQNQKEMINTMLNNNLPIEELSKYINLSIEEIKSIINK